MNQNQPLYTEIVNLLPTKYAVDNFLAEIDLLMESLFTTKTDISEKMSKVFPAEKKNAIENSCHQNGIDVKNYISVQRFLLDLKEYLKNLPMVNLTLAFNPKEEIIRRISSWFSYKLNTNVILHITVDSELIGGAIIGFNGKYIDGSLKKIVHDMIEHG